MANTILHKKSSVASKVPTTLQLSLGELSINTFDGIVYLKKNDGAESIVSIKPITKSNIETELIGTLTSHNHSYEHTQGTSTTTWTINHNLNSRLVNVVASDSSYIQIFPDSVSFVSVNQVVLTFYENVSGFAKVFS